MTRVERVEKVYRAGRFTGFKLPTRPPCRQVAPGYVSQRHVYRVYRV